MEGKQIRINISSFHLIKGMSMIIVILGHMAYFYDMEWVKSTLWGIKFFGAPLMPMFFIISGFGFKEKSIRKTLKTTFNGLVMPYIIVAVAFVVVYPIANYIGYGSWAWAFEVTFRYLLAFLLGVPKAGHVIGGYEVLHCSAVWFFLASFIALNILNIIIKVKKPIYQFVLVSVCILTGYFLILRDINYYCIPQGLMAVGSCYIGYLIKKYKLIERWITSINLYIVLIPIFFAEGIWGNMNLCLGVFKYGLWDYFGTIFSALLLIAVSLNLERYEGKVLNCIREIGVYSYWILCIHSVEDGCMQWELFINAMPNQCVAFLGEIILKVIIITSGCVLLKIITKKKYQRRVALSGK